MGSKKIEIVFHDDTIVNNLKDNDLIAEIIKSNKSILNAYYVNNFSEVTKKVLNGKNGVFAMFGTTENGAKKIIVDDKFISLFNSGNKDVCKGILAHEYGHYVDDKAKKQYSNDLNGFLKADVSADRNGAEATTKKTVIKALEYIKEYYEELKSDKLGGTIQMLEHRLNELKK